jgi:hypothetical protein
MEHFSQQLELELSILVLHLRERPCESVFKTRYRIVMLRCNKRECFSMAMFFHPSFLFGYLVIALLFALA